MPIKVFVRPRDNETPEAFTKVLKFFKRKVDKNGILREVKRRRYYEKPSEKKRRKWKENANKRRKSKRNVRKTR